MRVLLLILGGMLMTSQSTVTHAENWQGYSYVGGSKSDGFMFDEYNDFFPGFLGAGIHQFDRSNKLKNSTGMDLHFGIGDSSTYVTIGFAYFTPAANNKAAGFTMPISIGGRLPLDKGKRFTIGPYATHWSFGQNGTESEIGITLTYSPTGLR